MPYPQITLQGFLLSHVLLWPGSRGAWEEETAPFSPAIRSPSKRNLRNLRNLRIFKLL